MAAIIEAGEGWKYWNAKAAQEGLAAHEKQLKEYVAVGLTQGEHGFFGDDGYWDSIPTGFAIHVHMGKDVILGHGHTAEVVVKAFAFAAHVKFSPEVEATSEITTAGDVLAEQVKLPPSVVYHLNGPEAVLQLKPSGGEVIKVTNHPEAVIVV